MRILRRPRVNSALLEAVTRFPLTVLVAPMGYGKSTAARELAEEINTHGLVSSAPFSEVFTFSANQGVTEAAYVWDRLFAQFTAQGSKGAQEFRNMGFPLGNAGRHRFLGLCRDYSQQHSDVVLVILDDWQFVESTELNFLLECLVRENLPRLSFLLLSRTRPNIPLDEFVTKGLACEFDLRLSSFSADETLELFASYGQGGLAGKDAALAAHALSEGWPIAVWLYLKEYLAGGQSSLAPGSNVSAAAEAMLSRSIYEPYPDEDKALLLALAVPDSFTAETAAFICGNPSAQQRIPVLCDDNAFITLDGQGIYRFHSMFRTFLRNGLEGKEGERLGLSVADIIHRVAEAYMASGDMVRAIYTLHEAGREEDQVRILELFTLPEENMGMVLDPQGVTKIMLSLPEEVKLKVPLGWIAFIFHVISGLDPSPAPQLLDEAEKAFLKAGNLDADLALRMEGELTLVRAFLAYGDPVAMGVGFRKAFRLLQRTGNTRSSIVHAEQPWLATSPHAGFLYHTRPGHYEDLVQAMEKEFDVYLTLSGGCGAGGQALMRAEILLEQGKVDGIPLYIQEGEYRAKAQKQFSVRVALAFTSARSLLFQHVSQGQDRTDCVQSCRTPLLALEEEVRACGHPFYLISLELAQGYLLTLLDRADEVANWIQEGDFCPEHRFYQGMGTQYIVRGKVLLNRKRYYDLIAFSDIMEEALSQPQSPYPMLFGLLHTYTLRAIALAAIHEIPLALAAFAKAIDIGRRDTTLVSLGEYGQHILPLVRQLRKEQKTDAFLGKLHRIAKKYSWEGGRSKSAGLPLSPREQVVLEKVSLGLTNKEIAVVLGLAPSTVRNTLSRIYPKLNVENRAQAITVWKKDKR